MEMYYQVGMLAIGAVSLVIALINGNDEMHTRATIWIVGSMIVGALS